MLVVRQAAKRFPQGSLREEFIGPRWLEILQERKSDPIDHVRDEVRIALESGSMVIPVTVGGAKMVTAADLADFPDFLAG